jgi:hypothetical protein
MISSIVPKTHDVEGESRKGRKEMRILKSSLVPISAVLAMMFFASPALTQAQESPKYLLALRDLRTARDYIQADQRPGIGDQKRHAVDEINKALDEVKHAAWDDGKQTQFAPPSPGATDPWAPLRQAYGALSVAHKHISEGYDQPANQGYRDQAIFHIDQARHILATLVPPQ